MFYHLEKEFWLGKIHHCLSLTCKYQRRNGPEGVPQSSRAVWGALRTPLSPIRAPSWTELEWSLDGPFEKFPFVLEADYSVLSTLVCLLLLLLSHFSHVRLFATPYTSARQVLLPLGFSTQEHWSGLPFPSPMHEREKVKVKLLSPVRLLATPWTAAYQAPPPMGFPGKSTLVGCHCLLHWCVWNASK